MMLYHDCCRCTNLPMNLIFSPTLIVNNTLRTYPLEKAIYPVPKEYNTPFSR